MAFQERLAILISADAQGVVGEFNKVGDAADRNLVPAEQKADRFGRSLTIAGAGMIGTAAIIGAGLGSMARASEEAHRSGLLLDQTFKSMPQLAGASADAVRDLADSIQGKTAADGDAIVEGAAVLGQLGATEGQIRSILPLVVDYAQKFGIDIPTAAKAVGKALDGNAGTLERNIGQLDDASYEADRFGTVTEALAQKVGGFAEQEGQTFSGRLQRLKNELGDVQEGIGVGVVGALESLLGPVTKAADWFGDLDEETQKSIGTFAAYGTATLGAVGAISVVAGQLATLKSRFMDAETGALTLAGRLGAGVGIAGVAATAVFGLKSLADSMEDVRFSMEELADLSANELATAFDKIGQAQQGFNDFEANAQWEEFNRTLDENIGLADRIATSLEQRGIPGWEKAREAVDSKVAATQSLNEATAEGTELINAGTEATEENTAAVAESTTHFERAKEALDAYDASLDSVFGSSLSVAEQHIRTRQATDELRTAINAGQQADESAQQAKDRLALQTIALIEQVNSEVSAMAEAGEITNDATSKHDALLFKLTDLQNKFPELREEIQGHIDKLKKVPTDVVTEMKIHWDEARRAMGEYRAELDKIPAEKRTRLIIEEERHDSFRFENQASLNQQARAR